MNNYSEFQVNIFSNNRDIRKCRSFRTTPPTTTQGYDKGHNFVKTNGLPPLLVWVTLLIVNNYPEFQVNIFSNNRDIRKCRSFRTTPPTTTQGYDNTSTFSSKTAELKRKKKPRKLSNATLSVPLIHVYVVMKFYRCL